MHFLLVGPGALGCLLSSVISTGLSHGDRLTILDHNHDRAALISGRGVVCETDEKTAAVPVTALSEPGQVGPVDVVLLCVKSYDIAESLDFCRPLLSPDTLLVFFQNGISHLEPGYRIGAAEAAFATTTEGATLLGPGHVRHAGRGVTFLGFLEPSKQRAAELLKHTGKVLAGGGLQVEITDNILSRLWAKLFINNGINALTATLGCRNGELLTLPGVAERMERAVAEALKVAQAKEITVMDDPYRAARIVCSKTAENVSSMLQDVRNRRKTEIDAINGAVVSIGKRYGIETPENILLCHQVKEIESGFRQP